jgi:hypothetical protein
MDLLQMIQSVPGVGPYLPYVLMLFGTSAVIAAQLPTPRSSGLYSVVYGVVNLLGHNYNQARNALAPAAKAPGTPPAVTLLLICALTAPLMLAACSGAGSNAAADVAALEAGLTAAEGVATAYIQLPLCTGSNGPLCSAAATVAQIKTADAQAYTLVKAAEAAAGDPSALSAAEAAVTALTVITGALPVKGS